MVRRPSLLLRSAADERQARDPVVLISECPTLRARVAHSLTAAGVPLRTSADPLEVVAAAETGRIRCVLLDLRCSLERVVACLGGSAGAARDVPVLLVNGDGEAVAELIALRAKATTNHASRHVDVDLLEWLEAAAPPCAPAKCDQAPARHNLLARLTRRERQVLSGIAAGKLNKIVAAELGISDRTVEAHRGRVMRKLGVGSLAELVRFVVELERSGDGSPESRASRRGRK
jgi:FixJ family two-component response regulator